LSSFTLFGGAPPFHNEGQWPVPRFGSRLGLHPSPHGIDFKRRQIDLFVLCRSLDPPPLYEILGRPTEPDFTSPPPVYIPGNGHSSFSPLPASSKRDPRQPFPPARRSPRFFLDPWRLDLLVAQTIKCPYFPSRTEPLGNRRAPFSFLRLRSSSAPRDGPFYFRQRFFPFGISPLFPRYTFSPAPFFFVFAERRKRELVPLPPFFEVGQSFFFLRTM